LNNEKLHITRLSKELVDKVKHISKRISTYKQGDFLFREGENQNYIYLIEQGDVSLIKKGINNIVEIVHQNEGDLVGVDFIFNNTESGYSAVANEKTLLHQVLIDDFKVFLKENNNLSLELIQYLSSLIKQIENYSKNSIRC